MVCAGISDYPDKENYLNFTANDARAICEIYKKNGHAETFLTTDTRATRANVLAALKSIFAKASSQDAIMFFFSGHGSTNSFLCYDGHVMHEEIVGIMEKSHARTKIVMANACHSGKVRQAQKDKQKTQKRLKKEKVMFFLSSRGNELSWGPTNGDNSYFTSFLARGLRGAADANKDSIVSAREIYLFVSKGLSKQTFTVDGETKTGIQHPVMWGNFDHNMPVISWKRKKLNIDK